MKLQKKQHKTDLIAFLTIVFFVMLVLSALTPLVADDYNYAFNWSYEDDLVRIDNYQLILDSMAAHRYYTHGRVLAQGLVSVFLMWPRWAFFVANAALSTLFSYTLIHFFRRNTSCNPFCSAAGVLALYWICMPVFGQVFLWLDGACNYFWAAAFSFILLEAVFSLEQGEKKIVRFLFLLPFSFAVGSWSEHISFAALMIQLLYLASEWIRMKKLPVLNALILLSGCGGYLFLMLAPSMLPSILKNRAREAVEDHVQTFSSILVSYGWVLIIAVILIALLCFWIIKQPDKQTRVVLLFRIAFFLCLGADVCFGIMDFSDGGFYAVISSTAVGFLSLLCIFLLTMLSAIKKKVHGEAFLMPLILFFGGMSALLPFLVAMYIPARGFCAPTVFTGIAAVLLFGEIKAPQHNLASILCAILFSLMFLIGCEDILAVHQAEIERQAAIQKALAGDGVLVASPYPEKTKYSAQYGLLDIAEGEDWPKDMIKEFYGLKEIIVISKD